MKKISFHEKSQSLANFKYELKHKSILNVWLEDVCWIFAFFFGRNLSLLKFFKNLAYALLQ